MKLFPSLAATFAMLAGACATPRETATLQRFEFAELHMGTSFQITLYATDGAAATNSAKAAYARIVALEQTMTDYDPDSELMRLCKQPAGKPVRISEDLFDLLQISQRYAKLTDGAFDPTVGPLVQLWRRARRQRQLPPPERITEARRLVGYEKLQLDPAKRTATLALDGMRLDLGGIGKGYAADQALKVLRKHGITRAMVAGSGDIAIGDAPPARAGWNLGISLLEKHAGDLTRIVVLKNAAISTSGDAEQFVELDGRRYSHIIDPATGNALTNRIGVTIIAPNATTSDALDTPISVLGVERGLEVIESLPGVAALIATLDERGEKHFFESSRFFKIPTQPLPAK